MSDPTDREIAERNCPSDSHRPDKPGSYCECERILAALAEQREQFQDESTVYQELDEQQYDNMAEEAGRLARELIRLKRKTDDR